MLVPDKLLFIIPSSNYIQLHLFDKHKKLHDAFFREQMSLFTGILLRNILSHVPVYFNIVSLKKGKIYEFC